MDSCDIGFKIFLFLGGFEIYISTIHYTGLVLIIYIAKFIFLVDYWRIILLDINIFVEIV